jgi:hypothetical protein
MRMEKYKAEHLELLDVQEGQKYLKKYLSDDMRKSLEGEYSYTALDGDEVLACAGLLEQWDNRGVVWAYLSSTIGGRRMVPLTRMVARFLDAAPFDRIEATVDADFPQGHRWVKMLGFELEAPRMRKYRPDGGDSALYARIR